MRYGKAASVQLVDQIIDIETILLGVVQHPTPQGVGYKLAGNLFDIKPAAGFEDPENLRQTGLPIQDVVEGAEIKDCIVGRCGNGDMPGIAQPGMDMGIASMPVGTNLQHGGIKIKTVRSPDAELIRQQIHSRTAPAADLQNMCSRHGPPHAQQLAAFESPLHEGPQAIVHQMPFKPA